KEIRRKGYKYRIYPNHTQTLLINMTFGCTRKVHNLYLSEKNSIYELYKDYPELLKSHTCRTPATHKASYSYLKDVDSQALASECQIVNDSFRNFFKGTHKHPKFKRKDNNKQSYTSHTTNNNIRLEGNKVRIPKVGLVKIKKHRELPVGAVIKAITVSKNASSKYYVSLRIEYEEEIVNIDKGFTKVIGLDFSLNNLYIDHLGRKANYHKYLQKSLSKLAQEQRRLSRKKKGSNNRHKQRIKVARTYEKISNQRNDFLHKLSRKLVNGYDIICVESLDLKEMMKNKHFSLKINDNSYNKLLNYILYKTKDEGKTLIKVNKYYASSKICSVCGNKKEKLSLSERTYKCECGNIIDRDINAAYNIAYEGLRIYYNNLFKQEAGTALLAW
ncbi:MAG: transposase, partial [Candidatus Izimaplasma sp.]|nr:transposase [Candidatus Izimaplasma bacterium]